MNMKINKRQMISGLTVLVLFIMTFVMYFGIGLGVTSGSKTEYFKGFSGILSLQTIKNIVDADNLMGITIPGGDIYGSGLTIVIFSAFLLVTVIGSWFIPTNNKALKLGAYILNYVFLLLMFILSIVVLAEFMQFVNKEHDTSIKTSGVTIAFLIITGMILPLLAMGTLFDKKIVAELLPPKTTA